MALRFPRTALVITALSPLMLACGDDLGTGDAGGTDTTQTGDGDGDGASSLYDACDGDTYFPSGCDNDECVAAGLEQQIYNTWRERFMSVHGLSPEQMDARIVVSDVSISDGPDFVFWQVQYVFVLDWVRARRSDSINLGEFPLAADPTQAEIEAGVDLALIPADQIDLAGVASVDEIIAAFGTCDPGMTIDWCHIRFVNVTGILTVSAIMPVDGAQCLTATVDAGIAELDQCLVQGVEC